VRIDLAELGQPFGAAVEIDQADMEAGWNAHRLRIQLSKASS
jgi:hypothetical protein